MSEREREIGCCSMKDNFFSRAVVVVVKCRKIYSNFLIYSSRGDEMFLSLTHTH